MKAILEYNLPEESEEFKIAINGNKYLCALSEIRHYLRNEIKYNSDMYTKQERDVLDKIYSRFYEIINDEGIDID